MIAQRLLCVKSHRIKGAFHAGGAHATLSAARDPSLEACRNARSKANSLRVTFPAIGNNVLSLSLC